VHVAPIATHGFIYKSDDVDWSASRIAYQAKAMLENAELSIGGAKKLTDSAMLSRCDRESSDLRDTIAEIRRRWAPDQLPKVLRRLALNISHLGRLLRLGREEVWAALEEATEAGEGAKTLDLSPYGAMLASLIRRRGAGLFGPLAKPGRDALFVPLEVELPPLPDAARRRIVQPPENR
jgi:hypothetical protein